MTRDPQLAYMRLAHKQQLELMDKALSVERIRRRRDVWMSLAQASALNHQLTNAIVGLTGATIATVSVLGRKALNASMPPSARNKYGLGPTPLEIAGDALAALSGVREVVDIASGVQLPGTSRATAQSIAYDIPDSEGPVLLPAQATALPFRPPVPSRARIPR